jgi:hypothetical protein
MTEQTLRDALRDRGVPEHNWDGLVRYVTVGCPVGSFLTAVLENNLMESFERADEENRAALFNLCSFVYGDVPAPCHGSPENVRAWIEQGGLEQGGESGE